MPPTYMIGRRANLNNNNNNHNDKMNNLKKMQRPASWAYPSNELLLHDPYINHNNNNKFLSVS